MKKSCVTCVHYDVDKVKGPSGRIVFSRVAKCLWSADGIPLPVSITTAWNYNRLGPLRYMGPKEGTECPCWGQA